VAGAQAVEGQAVEGQAVEGRAVEGRAVEGLAGAVKGGEPVEAPAVAAKVGAQGDPAAQREPREVPMRTTTIR